MVFSSLLFIFIFVPITLLVYYFANNKIQNYVLLIFSLAFYYFGETKLISILLICIALNYAYGLILGNSKNIVIRKLLVVFAVVSNIGILFYFKFSNFFIDNINYVFNTNLAQLDVIMPIGISFFTFQALSYVLDVYRGITIPQKDIYKVALYISFFPQLIAGPIVKYHDINQQLDHREHTLDNLYDGSRRFIVGLSKKVIIANTMAIVVDNIYMLDPQNITPALSWIAAICYTLQIYFDFSGYSDMAIGLGKLFGFRFLENFNYPYISKNMTEFWRRWHISLSTWFKEYLYIPLGGNRKGRIRTYLNLFIVFILTGFWHGAEWSFIIWGLWNGLFLIIERIFKLSENKGKLAIAISRIYTLLVVIIGWVFFRANTLAQGLGMIKKMFFIDLNSIEIFLPRYYLDNMTILIILLGVVFSMPVYTRIRGRFSDRKLFKICEAICLVLLFIVSISFLTMNTYNPFIYFRF